MVLVSVTRLRVRKPEMVGDFVASAMASIAQATKATACLRAVLLRDDESVFWTMTLWADEAGLRDFLMQGDHRQAMPKMLEWCDEAAVVRFEGDGSEAVNWSEAHARLSQHGRPSRVRYPSDDHRNFLVRAPVVSPDRVWMAK